MPQVFTFKPVAALPAPAGVGPLPVQDPFDPLEALIQERLRDAAAAPTCHRLCRRLRSSRVPRPVGGSDCQAQRAGATPGASMPSNLLRATKTPPLPRPQAPPPPKRLRLTVTAGPAPTSRKPDRIIIVALDPGHGGEDPGAIGPRGTYEKDVVLKIAQAAAPPHQCAPASTATPCGPTLTRDADFFVPLAARVSKARRVQADLFISIHADAFTRPSASRCQRVCPEPTKAPPARQPAGWPTKKTRPT